MVSKLHFDIDFMTAWWKNVINMIFTFRIVPQKSIKPKQMQRISLNFSYTILQLYNSPQLHIYVCMYVYEQYTRRSSFFSRNSTSFFISFILLRLPRRAFHPVPPLSPSPSPLCGLMCNLICIILHVWRFGYSGVKVKRSMLTEL